MSGKVAKAKEDKDASKGKMRALYIFIPKITFLRDYALIHPFCAAQISLWR